MNTYVAFGISIQSDFELKPLTSVSHASATVSVQIRRGDVPVTGIEDPTFTRALTQLKENQVWLDVLNVARFEIKNGTEIIVDPYPDADEECIALYILGSCMGALLHQRGYLVLHANAIRIGNGAVIFMGDSGAGKSTTAAMFHKKGYEVLSDDIVAVDSNGCVINGLPQIKLWQSTLENLNIPIVGLHAIRPKISKYSLPLMDSSLKGRAPIKAIYSLHVQEGKAPDGLEMSPCDGVDRFIALKDNTYKADAIVGLSLMPQHMRQCIRLSKEAHMANIIRPSSHFCAPELVDMVLDDLANREIFEQV